MEIIVRGRLRIPTGSHEGKTVVIGSDHKGFSYKETLIKGLSERGFECRDVGTYSDDSCDYPKISYRIGREVGNDDDFMTVGIGICGSGIGITTLATKIKGVYHAWCMNPEKARETRKHNNSNMLGIGADNIGIDNAVEIAHAWLTEPFYAGPQDERFLRRFIQTLMIEHEVMRHGGTVKYPLF